MFITVHTAWSYIYNFASVIHIHELLQSYKADVAVSHIDAMQREIRQPEAVVIVRL